MSGGQESMELWSFWYKFDGAQSCLIRPANHTKIEILMAAHDLVFLGLDLIDIPVAPDHLVSKPLDFLTNGPDEEVGGQID